MQIYGLKPARLTHTTHAQDTFRAVDVLIELDIHWAYLQASPAVGTLVFVQMELKNTYSVKKSVKGT